MRNLNRASIFTLAVSMACPAFAQDATHGESVFKACMACHAKDHSNRAGPGLQGVIGRAAGTVPGFHYSRAMKQSKIVWNEEALVAYIAAPQKEVPGNIMPYAGMKNEQDRVDLVAYLKTLQ